MAYASLTNAFAITSITLEIRPAAPDGLLLFNKQANANGRDFIGVRLQNGFVEFAYNLGGGTLTLVSSEPLQLNEWHTVEVHRSGRNGQLIIDSSLPVTGLSPEGYDSLQLGDPLYIGGIEDSASNNVPVEFRAGGYHGCVRRVSVGSTPLMLISEAVNGERVGECPCIPNPCPYSGVCYEKTRDGETQQQCVCSIPFTGDLCTERESINYCKPQPHYYFP